MATVVLTREEVAKKDLPLVCLCCGEAASGFRNMGIYLKRWRMDLPLCELHKNHWLWRAWVSWVGFGAAFGSLTAGFSLGVWAPEKDYAAPALLLVLLGGLLAFIAPVVFLTLHFTAVHVTRLTNNSITLARVAPEFVEALRVHRQSNHEETFILPTGSFTSAALQIIKLAQQEAQNWNSDYLGTEHLLYGLSRESSGVASHFLKNLQIHPAIIQGQVGELNPPIPKRKVEGKLPQTPMVKKVIADALEEAHHFHKTCLDTEHLLLALLHQEEGVAAQVLMNLGLDLEETRKKLIYLLHPIPIEGPPKETGDEPCR